MTPNSFLLPILFVLNGLLVFLYTLVEHWQSALLLPFLAWLSLQGPDEHRSWALGLSGLALFTSLLSPQPLPILLLVMVMAGCLALRFEKFNPASLHWRLLSGVGLYALTGAGISAFQAYIQYLAPESLLISQGQASFGILAAIGLYGMPVGFLAMLAQGLLVHPPIPGGGKPDAILHTLRARSED
jgi:hypothetical protein